MNNKRLILYCFYLISLNSFSQVGINIDQPTATLDVNGNLKIRGVIDQNSPIAKNSNKQFSISNKVLVVNDDGIIHYDTNIIKNSYVKGGNSSNSTSLISLDGISGWNKIAFENISFDYNNKYDLNRYEFIAKNSGIYAVYIQYTTSSLISASNVGVGILKRKASENIYTLEAEESFSNVSVLGISVSPPTRKFFSIVDLNEGDAITFVASGLSLSIQLLGGADTYFTIFQIK
ncbi:hypothetical protein ETU09_07760 [Apibacter muscae]|uniref:C1q domain-containing protein n=1 Tax=Apibacter muscae TaxID=2509004 RepID=A0A563DBP1_9FLAO|nr:hypothetical protein [Apibacter muscae]TWP27331.1 hypothetical protein ETU09_07760 [Apibacter muscae]